MQKLINYLNNYILKIIYSTFNIVSSFVNTVFLIIHLLYVVKNLNNMNKIGENRKMHYIFNYKRNLLQCNKPFFPLTDAETN